MSCGVGSQNRTRLCQVDGHTVNSRNCTGPGFETDLCNEPPCPGIL